MKLIPGQIRTDLEGVADKAEAGILWSVRALNTLGEWVMVILIGAGVAGAAFWLVAHGFIGTAALWVAFWVYHVFPPEDYGPMPRALNFAIGGSVWLGSVLNLIFGGPLIAWAAIALLVTLVLLVVHNDEKRAAASAVTPLPSPLGANAEFGSDDDIRQRPDRLTFED